VMMKDNRDRQKSAINRPCGGDCHGNNVFFPGP
jgi:hypothetical protein